MNLNKPKPKADKPLLYQSNERGELKHFHGRKEELLHFNGLLDEMQAKAQGSTFLVQGSPGAGKSTLLEKCMEEALEKGWHVAKIEPNALYNKQVLKKKLGFKDVWKFWQKSKVPIRASFAGFGFGTTIELNHTTFQSILNRIQKPTLLVLDEAQRLGDIDKLANQEYKAIRDVLSNFHNGHFKNGFVFLVAGLNQTYEILEKFHISRFSSENYIRLGVLDKVSERKIIEDWLIKESKVDKDNPRIIHWISKIAEETHGWPVHIVGYTNSAFNQIIEDNGQLTEKGLKIVLEKGLSKKNKYYHQRTHGIDSEEKKMIVDLLNSVDENVGLGRNRIITYFQKTLSLEKSELFFEKLFRKGVLHLNQKSNYEIPIPSMKTWLVENYGGECVDTPTAS
ncbi:MAG: ATP-binding protein [Flavobacteriaceae bacterium]|nr:ATP-binding protein [Flavobacteriaceae bacterium]MCY4267172.1 ATP-binding protein [Flavobacteriaceae bacterium]MCY4298557.1 ATP-binding protein [Flavobacteriaceae bacterium]